jgi:hypothetical protein
MIHDMVKKTPTPPKPNKFALQGYFWPGLMTLEVRIAALAYSIVCVMTAATSSSEKIG